MLNKTVKETLDKKYRYPIHVAVVKGSHCVDEHPVDYGGYSDSDIESSESNNDDSMLIQDVKQGSSCALSISNMHNMPVPSPTLSGSHMGASTSSKEPVSRNVTYKPSEYISMTCHNSLK